LSAVAATLVVHGATNTLPASAALPLGSASDRGFMVRTVQAPVDAAVLNNSIRALKQINGTLKDADGNPVPNEAIPGPAPTAATT